MARAIPERAPLGDHLTGVVLRVGSAELLGLEPDADAEVIAQGSLVARYAVRFLGKTHLSIVPGLVVLDYGDILTGEEAWQFLTKRSHLYPRSEVVGFRNDGADDMVFIRQLDLAQPVEVLVYENETATLPIASPRALIARDASPLPPRLTTYLPVFSSVADWQTEQSR